MSTRVQVSLTLLQLKALEWMASYGTDEKLHVLNQVDNGYDAEDEREQRRDVRTAENAIAALQGALKQARDAKTLMQPYQRKAVKQAMRKAPKHEHDWDSFGKCVDCKQWRTSYAD